MIRIRSHKACNVIITQRLPSTVRLVPPALLLLLFTSVPPGLSATSYPSSQPLASLSFILPNNHRRPTAGTTTSSPLSSPTTFIVSSNRPDVCRPSVHPSPKSVITRRRLGSSDDEQEIHADDRRIEADLKKEENQSREGEALDRGKLFRKAMMMTTMMFGSSSSSLPAALAQVDVSGLRKQASLPSSPSPLQAQGYVEQLREAIPVKTIRGIWRIREFRDGEDLCKGRLKFRGFVEQPNKGVAEYMGCGERKGRGNWLLKPGRIDNGQISFSARWKIKFRDGDALIYRGDVKAGGNYAKAKCSIVKGEILRPVTGITGNLTEKRCGSFEADLIEEINDEEKL